MTDQIAQIADIIKSGKAIIFAGAGLSAEAGLPTWPEALEQLAEYISGKDVSLAQVMRERVRSQKLLEAAELYYLADADFDYKINGLELIFGKDPKITEGLRHLAGVKPCAFITTNYDLTIEHTWSGVFGRAIHSLRNREEEFPTAYRGLNAGRQFVFHIHGSVEDPRNIIFSRSSFDDLLKMDEYFQFLRHVLMTRSLIFIGLSFNDPALKKFLEYAREKLSLICEQPSFAFVERNELELAKTLQEAHVTPVFYDKGGKHEELWNLITEIHKTTIKTAAAPPLVAPEGEEIKKLRANLAAVYAHYRIKSKHTSAGDSVYAGIVRTIGWERQSKYGKVTALDLAEELRQVLHIEIGRAESIVSQSMQSLVKLGLLNQEGGTLLFQPPDDSIHEDLDKVILSIRDRIKVRYSAKIQISDEKIKEFLLISLVNDGVRLAHSILSRFPLTGAAVDAILDSSYEKVFGGSKSKDGDLLLLVTKSLLDSPNKEEALILGLISRIAFLTDLILHEPDLKSYNIKSRPAATYIDANFLLPAICRHHPRNIFYGHILEKGRQKGMKILVQEGFVEETMSHRRLALEEFDKEFRGRRERFENYIHYYGTTHINVFLGGFAGWLSEGKPYEFSNFLNECAPYRSVGELIAYLLENGFQVESSVKELSLEGGSIASWKGFLKSWYKDHHRIKEDPLINNEAVLLESLKALHARKEPRWFLTADRQFILASIAISVDANLAPDISSLFLMPQQISYFVEMDDDRNIDWQTYSRLLWSRTYKDHYEKFSEFYIDRVLREYEPKLAAKIPELLNSIGKEIDKVPDIPIDISESDESTLMKHFRYFESFEERFYELMRKEKEKLGLI